MIIGYARVSTVEQSLDRQIDQLTEADCKRIYQEKASGASKECPELDRMLDALREGDVVVVTELSRLGRTVKGLIELVEKLHKLDVDLKSLKEQWLDTTSPMGKMVFTMMAGFAEMERDLIRERTAEGLKAARARGRRIHRTQESRS